MHRAGKNPGPGCEQTPRHCALPAGPMLSRCPWDMDTSPPGPTAPDPAPPVRTPDMVRRVGVEIEFLGLSARDAALVLARHFGGTADAEDPHAYRIQGTWLGDLV